MGLFPTWHLKGTAMRRKEKRWVARNRFIKEEGPVAVGKSGTDNTSVATNSGKVVGWKEKWQFQGRDKLFFFLFPLWHRDRGQTGWKGRPRLKDSLQIVFETRRRCWISEKTSTASTEGAWGRAELWGLPLLWVDWIRRGGKKQCCSNNDFTHRIAFCHIRI